MIDKNVKAVVSGGAECFICNQPIRSGQYSIRLTFDYDLILTTTELKAEMDVACGENFLSLLARRIKEAKGGKGHGR